jgi:hypothetical protein
MGVLKSAQRNKLPDSSFALSGRRFPLVDKIHQEKALQLAPRSEHAGNITASEEMTVEHKARKALGSR